MAVTKVAKYATRLPAEALGYLGARSAIEVGVTGLAGAAAIVWLVPDTWRNIAWAILSFLVILGVVVEVPILNRLIVRNTSYEVTGDAVRIHRGMLFRRDIVIATAQLLNVTIVDGPLLRRRGLAKVSFSTIAHVEPLGPVKAQEAERLRRLALALYLGDTHDEQ